MTTLILGLGFAPFLASDYYSTRMMGSLLPLCLFVALVADLLLVPAMIKDAWVRFPKR
jgi:predicted RND superfamily exporter protein